MAKRAAKLSVLVQKEEPAKPGAPKPRKADAKPRTAGRQGMKAITIWVDPFVGQRLKILSATSGRAQEDLLKEAVSDLFAKHRAP